VHSRVIGDKLSARASDRDSRPISLQSLSWETSCASSRESSLHPNLARKTNVNQCLERDYGNAIITLINKEAIG
jgi:hypothetical protein